MPALINLVVLLILVEAGKTSVADIKSIITDASKLTADVLKKIDDNIEDDVPLELLVTLSLIAERSSKATYLQLSMHIQFDKLETDVLHIGYSYTRLLLYLQAASDAKEISYNEFFRSTGDAVKHAHFLAQRLTETVPGITNNLLDILASRSRCNMTTLEVFEEFYFEMLHNGMVMELLRQSMQGAIDHNATREHWTRTLQNVKSIFATPKPACRETFLHYLVQDIDYFGTGDVRMFQMDNSQRYTWIWNDVFILRNDVGDPELYFVGNTSYYLRRTTSPSQPLDTVVVFSEKDSRAEDVAGNELTNIINNMVPIGTVNNADVVASSVKAFLCSRNYTVELIIVYPLENETVGTMALDPDTHSVSVMMTTGGKRFQIYMVLVRSNKCATVSPTTTQAIQTSAAWCLAANQDFLTTSLIFISVFLFVLDN